MVDYKNILTGVAERLSSLREERPSAGTRYRLMGVLADIMEAVEMLSKEVLDRVSQEAVLDADVDADFDVMSEKVLSWELTIKNDDLQELTQQVNDALGGLSNVLSQIGSQLVRHHSNEEYARLYEQEQRRYLGSKTAKSARKTFDEWKEDQCYGTPSMEDIDDYLLEKLLHMFEKGVFNTRVEHIQRATRYPGEFDFEQLDDDNKLKKTIYKHYAAFRKLVDWQDGFLVVNAARVGQHFYASRHEEKAKANRTNFLKYMHKIDLVQQERRQLMETMTQGGQADNPDLNYFAPAKNLKVLLNEEWFEIHRTDKRYDQQWTEDFVNVLMKSEHRDYIATEWGKDKRRDYIRGCVLGLLKEGGVIKGSMDSIARSANVCDNYRTFSRYMGQCRQEPYADWVLDYLRKSA
jgi:hypothetical protein